MDTTQRFLRRLALLNDMDRLLRESKYHRDNEEAENLPGSTVWKLGDEIGEGKVEPYVDTE